MRREVGPLPIEITENGASYNTAPDAQGKIHDQARIAYLRSHLQVLAQAIHEGVSRCAPTTAGVSWTTSSGQRGIRSASD